MSNLALADLTSIGKSQFLPQRHVHRIDCAVGPHRRTDGSWRRRGPEFSVGSMQPPTSFEGYIYIYHISTVAYSTTITRTNFEDTLFDTMSYNILHQISSAVLTFRCLITFCYSMRWTNMFKRLLCGLGPSDRVPRCDGITCGLVRWKMSLFQKDCCQSSRVQQVDFLRFWAYIRAKGKNCSSMLFGCSIIRLYQIVWWEQNVNSTELNFKTQVWLEQHGNDFTHVQHKFNIYAM